jgi:hypothetical protein
MNEEGGGWCLFEEKKLPHANIAIIASVEL